MDGVVRGGGDGEGGKEGGGEPSSFQILACLFYI